MRKYFGENKGYFFGKSFSLEHRATYGTANSVSDEKGSDKKKNNTSEYNHNYYVKHKEKWQDNKEAHDENSKDSDTDKEQEEEFDIDAAARDIIRGRYGNGEERKKALGEDYAMVQKRVNELMKQMKGSTSDTKSESASSEKKEEKTDESKIRSFGEVKTDYYKDKKKK